MVSKADAVEKLAAYGFGVTELRQLERVCGITAVNGKYGEDDFLHMCVLAGLEVNKGMLVQDIAAYAGVDLFDVIIDLDNGDLVPDSVDILGRVRFSSATADAYAGVRSEPEAAQVADQAPGDEQADGQAGEGTCGLVAEEELLRDVGASLGLLKEAQRGSGKFSPSLVSGGVRMYEAGIVDSLREYLGTMKLTATAFGRCIGMSQWQVVKRIEAGKIKPAYVNKKGHPMFSFWQVQEYLDGDGFEGEREGYLTRDGVARRLGISKNDVVKLCQIGVLTMAYKGHHGLMYYNGEEAEAAYKEYIEDGMGLQEAKLEGDVW